MKICIKNLEKIVEDVIELVEVGNEKFIMKMFNDKELELENEEGIVIRICEIDVDKYNICVSDDEDCIERYEIKFVGDELVVSN